MKKNGKYFTSISIGVAAVWFSAHCGAGFASGTQELQYFSNHGWFGIFMPLLTFAIIAFTYYVGLETARQTDSWGYDVWAKKAYGPTIGKVLSPAMDISVIMTTIAASAAAIATGGLLVKQYLGLPVVVGSLMMLVVITVLCIFGESLVRKNAVVMTSAMLIIIAIVLIAGLIKFAPQIAKLFGEKYVNPNASKWSVTGTSETVQGGFFNSFLWALTYAGFQMGAIGGVVSSFKGGSYKNESKGAMILGYVLNIIMLIGVCLLIFSQMPNIYTDQVARKLPTIFIVKQLDVPILSVLYPILLFLALITTAVGLMFGMVHRVEPYVLKNMNNQLLKKTIICVVGLLICYGVSTFGLMFVITGAYKYLGIFNWIFLIIPLWVIGYKNIRKRDRGELKD